MGFETPRSRNVRLEGVCEQASKDSAMDMAEQGTHGVGGDGGVLMLARLPGGAAAGRQNREDLPPGRQ